MYYYSNLWGVCYLYIHINGAFFVCPLSRVIPKKSETVTRPPRREIWHNNDKSHSTLSCVSAYDTRTEHAQKTRPSSSLMRAHVVCVVVSLWCVRALMAMSPCLLTTINLVQHYTYTHYMHTCSNARARVSQRITAIYVLETAEQSTTSTVCSSMSSSIRSIAR